MVRRPIGPRPVDSPAPAGYLDPHQLLGWGSPAMVVEGRGAFVETARVPGIAIVKSLVVEVMTELVTQGAQERPERCDPLADGGPHPDADQPGLGIVVPELGGPTALAAANRPRRKDADIGPVHLVEVSGDFSQTNTCSTTLPIGANCTISVTLMPRVPGLSKATLTITDNAATSPQKIALTGTGAGPEVTLSPVSLKFPAWPPANRRLKPTSIYVGVSSGIDPSARQLEAAEFVTLAA
jgi:hypothetical protein